MREGEWTGEWKENVEKDSRRERGSMKPLATIRVGSGVGWRREGEWMGEWKENGEKDLCGEGRSTKRNSQF